MRIQVPFFFHHEDWQQDLWMKYSWSQWNTTPHTLLYRWLSHQRPISWIPQLHHDLGCSLLTDVSRTSWVFPLQKWCPSWLWSCQEVFHSVHQLCYIASTYSATVTFVSCNLIVKICTLALETHHRNTNNSLCVTLCTGIQGSLGFWLPYHGFRIPSAEFWILCHWNNH